MKRMAIALAVLACACSGPAPKPAAEPPGTWASADSNQATSVSYSSADGVRLMDFNCETEPGFLRIDAPTISAKTWAKGDRARVMLGGKTFDAEAFPLGAADAATIGATLKLSPDIIAALKTPGAFGVAYKSAAVTGIAKPVDAKQWSPSPVDLVPGCELSLSGAFATREGDDAGDDTGDAVAAGASATGGPGQLADWTGVYKHRFTNSSTAGETWEEENILEIVEAAPGRAYVRADLSFYNGHQCGFVGVAALEPEGLVYRGTADGKENGCVLTVRRGKDEAGAATVEFTDADNRCRVAYCSAGGGFNGVRWPASARRTIRYLDRLRASEEFAAALKEAGIAPVAPAKAAVGEAK